MSTEPGSLAQRLRDEIDLLHAMYPDQIHFDSGSRELKFTLANSTIRDASGGSDAASILVLRIPDTYPEAGLPDVISAVDGDKNDLRTAVRKKLSDGDGVVLVEGEEVLDAIVQAFEEVVAMSASTMVKGEEDTEVHSTAVQSQGATSGGYKVVVIWLHHLLNMNKRKLALHPSLSSPVLSPMTISGSGSSSSTTNALISGITKPGYPGILVYSGPSTLIDAHVADLKSQRWQAFQVRYEQIHKEERDSWIFEHGRSIKEVESMSGIVQGIIGETNREAFLKAAGIK